MITDRLISSQQRGFMQGRSILDCTGTVSEAYNLLENLLQEILPQNFI